MGVVIGNKMYASVYMCIVGLSACLVFSKGEDVTILVSAYPPENLHVIPERTFTITPGTDVELRCRLGNFRRSLLDWNISALATGVKSEVLNPNTGAFEVVYFISEAKANNSGEYTCFDIGGKSHTVFISVKSTLCETPRDPENGTALYSSLEYDSELSYKCNEGYSLSSNGTRVCDVYGEWNGTEPLCEEIICEKPEHPTNGKAFYKLLKFGYETIYECNTGYRLSHSQSRVCGPDGRWNGTEPFCQVVRCDIPENPENGEAQYISMEYNSLVWYKCHEGYQLSSRTRRKCGADGQWTRSKPFCKAISCRKPKNPENGRALYTSLKYKSELKYVCNIGHYLSSDKTRICSSTGKWNGTESLCIVIKCETPKDPRHGRALYDSTEYNAKLKYKCDEGYQLSIRYTRTCASDGKWTSSEPSCEDVKEAFHL